jgi:hypothetical protein
VPFAIGIMNAPFVRAQSNAGSSPTSKPLTFDVASVKPSGEMPSGVPDGDGKTVARKQCQCPSQRRGAKYPHFEPPRLRDGEELGRIETRRAPATMSRSAPGGYAGLMRCVKLSKFVHEAIGCGKWTSRSHRIRRTQSTKKRSSGAGHSCPSRGAREPILLVDLQPRTAIRTLWECHAS